MNTPYIKNKFEAIGARATFGALRAERWGGIRRRPFTLDIQTGRHGEYFEIRTREGEALDFTVLDVQPADRHLLLMVKGRELVERARPREFTQKFLCGHDERHWFVAAAPTGSTVAEAKEALKPAPVVEAQTRVGIKPKVRHARKNAAFVRQGEWFFIPCPDLLVNDLLVLKDEPIRRGRGKPHIVQFLYRRGGTTVHVCSQFPAGLTESEFKTLVHNDPEKKHLSWQIMKRDPEAFAKGKVRHPDHKTVVLPFWHRIAMNTESAANGGASVAFLD
jgi:hypothetical protein